MGIIDGSHGDRGRADIGAMPAKESLAGTALAVQFDGLAGLPLLAGRPNFPTTPCSNIISAAPKIHHNASGYWQKVARTQREMDMIKARLQHTTFQDGSAALPDVHGMTEGIQARLTALGVSISVVNTDQILANQNLFPEMNSLRPLGDPPCHGCYLGSGPCSPKGRRFRTPAPI